MIYEQTWSCECGHEVVDDDFCPRCGKRDPELCDHHHFPGRCDVKDCRNFCAHQFTGQQIGGPPDAAESYEWIEYCKLCGYEPQD